MTRKSKGVYFRGPTAYIRYQDVRGHDVRESTKQRSAKAARDILAKRKTEVAVGTHFPTRAFDTLRFSELAEYWWEAHGSKTRSQFQYLYPRVVAHFAGRRAREITPDVVDAFLDHLAVDRKLSASSVNHHRTILNGIFNFAVRRGRFDKNPVAAVRQRPEPPGRDRIVSPTEFRALWEAAKDDKEMRAFLALAEQPRCARARCYRFAGIASTWATRRLPPWFARRPDTSATCRSLRRSSARSRCCPPTEHMSICSPRGRRRSVRSRSGRTGGTAGRSFARSRRPRTSRTSVFTIYDMGARRF
jgi:hypothetical protein